MNNTFANALLTLKEFRTSGPVQHTLESLTGSVFFLEDASTLSRLKKTGADSHVFNSLWVTSSRPWVAKAIQSME